MDETRSESRRQLVAGTTLGAGVVLALALFVMANYLMMRHYWRMDTTSSQVYSLSAKSKNVVAGLDQEVEAVIFLPPGSELFTQADELLTRYAAVNPALFKKRVIDPARNILEARQLVDRFQIDRENVIVLATENDRRIIHEDEMVEFDYSGVQYGQGPKLKEFKGEQQITSALLELVEAEKPKILFTTGHGELSMDYGERSLSQARASLGEDNFEIEEWSSLTESAVPPDTDLVVIAGPTTNFLEPELEIFSRYLESGGRMLILLDPLFAAGAGGELSGEMTRTGLEDWLAGYGVKLRQDVVIDPVQELPLFGPETLFTDSYGMHPIVDSLDQRGMRVLLPLARSVSRADGADGDFEVTELLRTSEEAWGETDLSNLDELAPGDEDVAGPVPLAVAVTLGGGDDDPLDGLDAADDGLVDLPDEGATEPGGEAESGADPGRLVVFGDSDFATDAQIVNFANSVLLLNTFNWLVQREQLIDIEARKPAETKLSLSRSQLNWIYLLVMLGLPGAAAITGVMVHLSRRR